MPDSSTSHSPGPVLVFASLSVLLGSLDTSVNIAFPAISAAFDLGVTGIQWVVVSYVLTYASLMLACGRLADVWGHGRVLTAGLAGSALAFVLCGLAPSFSWFLAARVIQGVAVAMVLAASPALVTLAVSPELRGRALGLFQMSMAAGLALGPLVGGVLVAGFGWRAVFLFRVIPALALAFFAARHPPFTPTTRDDRGFDLLGSLTLALSVAGSLVALSRGRQLGWNSPAVVALLVSACGCFAAFLVTETRVTAPVVDLRLFRRPAFSVANALNAVANGTMFAIWLLVPYFIVDVLGYPTSVGGIMLVPFPLAAALAAPVSGRLSDRFGTGRLSSLGLGLEALGLWTISHLDAQSGYPAVVAALVLVGLGLGVFQAANMSYVMGAIPRVQQGVAGGMSQTMRTLGVVLGVTGASVLFDSRRALHAGGLNDFVPAFQDVFLVAAAICAVAFGLSLLRGRE